MSKHIDKGRAQTHYDGDDCNAKPQANRLDERVVYELNNLIHKDACEVMCGWSDKCDKDENCVPLRKRIAELLKENK